ncbi:hypothetical protein FLGE108171_15850 [Flavobacterium gelidilacus]|uniref:hypothetical protein n=1 Tax=Flavobacterium gelidilacus TaxID=206041 RepID=UPI0004128422|nr:hypothetical protein [Flavobacterium gelidilacus]
MKKFVIKFLLILSTLILLMTIADYYITKKLRASHNSAGEIEVWNDIYNKNIDADIAIYGSSRAWVHISPTILEDTLNIKAYNFGIDGQSFPIQYLRHIEYLKYNKSPKVIIASVDIFSLAKTKDLYGLNQFLPYMLWNNNIKKFTSPYNGFSYEDYYFPLIRYYGNLKKINFNKINNEPLRYKGYKGMEREWNADLAKAKLKMNKYNIDIDSSSIKLFEQFLLECKTDKITVILVYTPEHIDGQKFVKNRKEIINIYNDFSNKYNLLFLDYSNDELCQKKDYFYNASHLNKKGSEIFTSKLSHDIKARTHNTVYN